jgi:hypothetical protein
LVDITSDQETSIAPKTPSNSNTQVKQISLTTPPILLDASSPVHSPLEPRRLIFDDKIGKNSRKESAKRKITDNVLSLRRSSRNKNFQSRLPNNEIL